MALMQDGDFNKSSDVDIMILTDLTNKEIEQYRTKIVDCAWELECKTISKLVCPH